MFATVFPLESSELKENIGWILGGDSDHTFIFAWKTIPNASFFSWGHGCNGPGAFYQVHTGGVGRTERALGRVNRAMLAEKEEAVEHSWKKCFCLREPVFEAEFS